MSEIRNIMVAGEGTMGSSIFLNLCDFDFNLTWLCSSSAAAFDARNSIEKRYRRFVTSGSISERAARNRIETIKFISEPSLTGDCDLVIESVNEDAWIKRNLFNELCRHTGPRTILTSNSSSIVMSELLSDQDRAARSAGLHFFYPAAARSTVELIISNDTSAGTIATLESFIKKIKKTIFLQNEKNPFILNRILLDLQADSFNILKEYKISAGTLDQLVSDMILPTGIFRFFDQVGIDIMMASVKSYLKYENDEKKFEPMLSAFREKVAEGKLGIKSKEGFLIHRYIESKKEYPYENLSEDLKSEIAGRVRKNLIISVNRILEKKICSKDKLKYYLQDFLLINNDSAEQLINNS